MPRKRVDQRATRNRPTDNEQSVLLNASEIGKLAYRRKHTKTRNGNREDEENISKLDYELSSYSDLLIKAMEPIRGQKQLLKRLYLDVDEVLEKCTVNELRRAVYEPCFITSLEGKKLAAHFILKIGIEKFWILVKKVITSEKTTKIQCSSYGDVLLLAWKNAVKDGIHRLQYQLERIFMDVVYYALQHLRYNKKFMAMLESFGKARSKQIDAMIYRTFEPNLWRCLKAANETVRFNACCLFLPFYPFVSDDDIENAENINMQQGIIIDLLKDDSYGIRSEACRRTLFLLSTYFDTFPLDFIKQCLTQIIDNLSVDSNVNVRIAVYEGMRDLLRCASALNACERALKCLFDNRGINDRCDHVRLNAFQLLNALVGHRFIKLSEVVKMDRILKVFALEESDIVRKEIAKLLLPSYTKPGLSPDEVIRRIIVMGRESEIAALSFHHIIVAENLMTIEHAVQHAKSLVLAIYKALRSLNGIDGYETDEAMSVCSDTTTCETFVEPVQDKLCNLLICISVQRLNKLEEQHSLYCHSLIRSTNGLNENFYGNLCMTSQLMYDLVLALSLATYGLDVWANEASEKFKLWHSSRLLLNCLVVMWLPLRLILDDKKYAKENENLRRLLTKLFKFAFLHYRNASILEAVMHLGKTLDDWKEGKILVLQELLQSCSLDDEKATVYLEAAISWDFLALLKFIDDAFGTVRREIYGDSPPRKRDKKSKIPNDAFNRSLLYLGRMMKQPEIKHQLEHNYIVYVSRYWKVRTALTSLRQLIMENILQKKLRFFSFTLTFGNIISGIRMQYILAVMVLTGNEKDDEEELLKTMQDDVDWLKESIMPQFLADLTDEQLDMVIKVCETYICLWTQQLRTYNTPLAFRLALCDVQWIDNIKKSRGAVQLLASVIELFRNLIITATGIIQRPFDSCSEINEVIDFWVNKILLKHRLLRCSVLVYLKDQIENHILFAITTQEDEIYCYGAVIQFLLLLRSSAKKITDKLVNNSMRKSRDLYEACVEMLDEKLRGLSYKYEKNEMFLHMNDLFANIRESSQSSSGCSGGSDTGNNSLRQQHLGGAVYISACETKLDTIVFMHKWNIVQFWAQLELSSLGDFIDSRLL
ncbi:unnamed protein product [Onchocerca ochengi]|uniref:Condensin complex subunit 1 n=1 Tax=Onchocerca ochengi TaxID=42157 RepID=A0A182E4N8_ONCOC|nr:unnamed protein product [Onchocerca ochengi]